MDAMRVNVLANEGFFHCEGPLQPTQLMTEK